MINKSIRCLRKKKRAMSGITAAIILIAFVIIASLIAFVILSMGQQFASQAEQAGEDAKNFAFVVQEGKLFGYDKYTFLQNNVTKSYTEIVAIGTTSTNVTIVSSNSTYYAVAGKTAYDTLVFQLRMPTTATGILDFTKVRVQLEIKSAGTHVSGGAYEFQHDTNLDDLGVDGTASSSLTTSTADDGFGWEDLTGDDDDLMEPGETYRVTLRVDVFAMGTKTGSGDTEKHGFGYPHEIYQNDQFEITIFVGQATQLLGPFTAPSTIEASKSW